MTLAKVSGMHRDPAFKVFHSAPFLFRRIPFEQAHPELCDVLGILEVVGVVTGHPMVGQTSKGRRTVFHWLARAFDLSTLSWKKGSIPVSERTSPNVLWANIIFLVAHHPKRSENA